MMRYLLLLFFTILFSAQSRSQQKTNLLTSLTSPVLFRGNESENPAKVKTIKLFFYDGEKDFRAPKKFTIEYLDNDNWKPVAVISKTYEKPVGSTANSVNIKTVTTNKIRVTFENQKSDKKYTALSVVEIY